MEAQEVSSVFGEHESEQSLQIKYSIFTVYVREQILSSPLPLVVGFLIQNFISSQSIFHRRGPLHSYKACKNFRAFSLVQYSTRKHLFIKFSKTSLQRKIFVCLGVYYMGHSSMDGKLILSCRPTPNDGLSPVPRRFVSFFFF